MRTVVATATALFAQACGGSASELAPGAGSDPGTGTGTLAIEGTILAMPDAFNAPASGDFETEFSLRVSRNDQVVRSGTVTVASATGKIPLTYGDGRWTATSPRYDEVYVLDIASGADRLDGVRVDGPDVFVFSEPLPGATVSATLPVTIRWNRTDEADAAAVRTDTIDWIAIPDAGSYALPAGAFRPDKSAPRQHTLRLARTNRVVPAGAAAGSTWSVTIENQLDLNTEAQPPL